MPRAFQRTFSVQGLNILDKGKEWDDAANAHTTNIRVAKGEDVGQPTYPTAFMIDDEFAGYPPELIADEISDVMEQGWPIELRILEANPFNEDWSRIEKIDGEEYPQLYATAKVQVYAIPPKPTPKQTETFESIKREREKKHEAWKTNYAKWQKEEEEERIAEQEKLEKEESNEMIRMAIVITVIVVLLIALFAHIMLTMPG